MTGTKRQIKVESFLKSFYYTQNTDDKLKKSDIL